MGKLVLIFGMALAAFSAQAETDTIDCTQPGRWICTAHWAPESCTYQGVTVEGSNGCVAQNRLEVAICALAEDQDQITIDTDQITCQTDFRQ